MTAHVVALSELESWHAGEFATRVRCRGADDAYSIEYYEPSDCVPYWKMKDDGEVAIPVGRNTVPDSLHERIRQGLVETGIDPEVEDQVV